MSTKALMLYGLWIILGLVTMFGLGMLAGALTRPSWVCV